MIFDIKIRETEKRMDLFMTFILSVALVCAQSPENDELQFLEKRSSDDGRLQTLEGQYAKMFTFLSGVQENMTTMESTVSAQLQKISFTARAYSKDDFSAGSAIEFDTVIEETGGTNYDPSNGKFTCPISGVYAFSTTLINDKFNRRFAAYIMLDDVFQTALYGSVQASYQYETAAGTITIRCNAGQTVYVRTYYNLKIATGGFCYFSGFFLFN